MIPFNKPPIVGREQEYMLKAMASGKLCGDGNYTRQCEHWFEENLTVQNTFDSFMHCST